MDGFWERLTDWGMTYGSQVLGAIVTLITGYIAARIGRRVVRRLLERAKVAPAIISFGARLAYALILIFAVVATLARFGVQTTSFVAILGAAGFAIGFALQGALSNFAAGVLLLIQRPFRLGDYVEVAGMSGTVKDIQLFTTVLATPDNVKVIVPNGKIYGDTIKNYSAYDTRRLDLTVGIGYGSSIQKAFDVLFELIAGDERILAEPEPQIIVSELADSSVNLTVRCWVGLSDFWPTRFDLTRRIKETFDEYEIEIPFPQHVVHIAAEQ